MEEIEIEGVVYVRVEQEGCRGCAGDKSTRLCSKLVYCRDIDEGKDYIFVEKKQ